MVRLIFIAVFVCVGSCSANRPDTVEKPALRDAYEACFAVVERDVGIDLRSPEPSWTDAQEHYRLARMRIVAAVNEASVEYAKHGSAALIELPYLIALENADRFPEHYPLYDHQCRLTPDLLG